MSICWARRAGATYDAIAAMCDYVSTPMAFVLRISSQLKLWMSLDELGIRRSDIMNADAPQLLDSLYGRSFTG